MKYSIERAEFRSYRGEDVRFERPLGPDYVGSPHQGRVVAVLRTNIGQAGDGQDYPVHDVYNVHVLVEWDY